MLTGEERPRRLLRRPARQADGDRVRRVPGAAGRRSASSPTAWRVPSTVDKVGADNTRGRAGDPVGRDRGAAARRPGRRASHRRIFGDLPQKPAPIVQLQRPRGGRLERAPMADAERILRDFARRAFRRAVTDDDVKPFVALVKAKLADEALVRAGDAGRPQGRAGLAGVPVPPREARQARRLRPGQPAVVLPLEHDARRRAARRSPSRRSCSEPDDAPRSRSSGC